MKTRRNVFDERPCFREAVLGEAGRQARLEIESAETEAGKRIESARAQAEEMLRQARREGAEAAARETRRERSEARRRARELVLRARRQALERLRDHAVERLREQNGSGRYEGLMSRLEERARRQLDGDIEIRIDAQGGFVARSDRRSVDYRLPALVDRIIGDMGSELEDAWK